MSINMKASLIASLFFTAFVTYVNGQGEAIDIEALKCLCNLQMSGNMDGAGDCGLGDPAPKLSIDCEAVLNDDVEGAFFYILELERTSLHGPGPLVTFDKLLREVTGVNFPQGLSEDNDLTIVVGTLTDEKESKGIWILKDHDPKRLSLCKNDQTPGSMQHTLVEMSKQVLIDSRECPLEKGAKTSVIEDPPQKFPPTIYQFPQMLPCEPLTWGVRMNDRNDKYQLQLWIDLTPKGLCTPPAPRN